MELWLNSWDNSALFAFNYSSAKIFHFAYFCIFPLQGLNMDFLSFVSFQILTTRMILNGDEHNYINAIKTGLKRNVILPDSPNVNWISLNLCQGWYKHNSTKDWAPKLVDVASF